MSDKNPTVGMFVGEAEIERRKRRNVTTTEASVETRRQIAEDLMAPAIGKVAPMVWRETVADIEAALKERDERAAKITENHEGHGDWCASASGDCQSLTVKAIAAAIRKE
jgi:hypothetical protein